MSTNTLSVKQVQRSWRLFDAKNQTLGRLAASVAKVLMGKDKPMYVPYLDCGDNVVIINASLVKVTGKKEAQKKYVRHSGFPGGLKVETLAQLRERKPEELIRHAVWGMIPKGKLGRSMIKKLHIFANPEHPFKDKFKKEKSDE